MTPEQKLAALFAAEAPPARDYVFQAAVAKRIALRRAWLTVAALFPWAIAATALLWALGPMLVSMSDGLAAMVQPLALVAVVSVATGVAALRLARRFSAG